MDHSIFVQLDNWNRACTLLVNREPMLDQDPVDNNQVVLSDNNKRYQTRWICIDLDCHCIGRRLSHRRIDIKVVRIDMDYIHMLDIPFRQWQNRLDMDQYIWRQDKVEHWW